jgi:drug/metabolite transporter (DMT)-like permease
MTSRLQLALLLLLMGAAWGLSQPLSKIAVSTGYQPFGLITWELVFMVVILAAVQALRRRPLTLSPAELPLMTAIAVLGTVFPNFIFFRSVTELPAGVMAIIIAVVPMFSVPVAFVMGTERPGPLRILGVLAGAAGVWLLIGPEAGLGESVSALFILTACLAPLSYAVEGNVIARLGAGALDPVRTLLGASVIGLGMSAVLMVATGQQFSVFKPWDAALWALLASTFVHAIAYAGYVWIVGQAGPVFAAQVSYIVTVTGILWSMVILGERYAGPVWAAFALMMLGIALVRPAEAAEAPLSTPAD